MKSRRVTGDLWLTCGVIHLAGWLIYSILMPGRFPHSPPREQSVTEIFWFASDLLLFGTPGFAYVWSWLYVGWYNKRYPPAPRCHRCGYDPR